MGDQNLKQIKKINKVKVRFFSTKIDMRKNKAQAQAQAQSN